MYKIILCEDDKKIAAQMRYFFKMNSVKVIFDVVSTGEELLRRVHEGEQFDVFLLGNMLRALNGMEVARRLRKNGVRSEIIFLSGVDCYYYDAFEVEAFRFLKKPIDWVQFRKCMQQVIEKLNVNNKYFYYKRENKIYKILISEILYFESSRRVVNIITTKGIDTFYDRLDTVEESIRKKNCYFIRTHKSYLVNTEYISLYDYNKLHLTNKQALPISENRRIEIRNELFRYVDGLVCGLNQKVARG